MTINKVCGSGLKSVALAAQAVQTGNSSIVVAGGMESMTNAPYLLPQARKGYRLGNAQIVDSMVHDGLWDAFFQVTMADESDKVSEHLGISRERQDEYALRSHMLAIDAFENGRLADELISLRVATKARGKLIVDAIPLPRELASVGAMRADVTPDAFVAKPERYSPYLTDPSVPFTLVDRDEAPRKDTNLASLAKLKPINKGGNITAGNAPGVNDGAAALVLTSDDYARANGLAVLGRIVGHATAAWDPPYLPLTPAMAAQKLLEQHGLRVEDIALWEINEAFAAVALSSIDRLGLDIDRVNVDGGAIAFGHPLGASGARIVGHLIHALRRRGGGYGVAAICSGGGQGDALLVQVT
jgi:acetyl-CoA C-acetyltransferase